MKSLVKGRMRESVENMESEIKQSLGKLLEDRTDMKLACSSISSP